MANSRLEIVIAALHRDFGVTVEISKYNPGDGWTRYGVSINRWHDIKEGMRKAECELYLQGAYDMLRVRWDESRRING